jgi:sucrose-6-phosphate hydrolase SacC (GH32 family)
MQVEIASNGTLYLNQYIRTEKIQSSIGKIGELDSSGRYQIEYATNYKLASNAVVDRHIQAIIIKATHHDIGFLKTQVTVTEPTQQLSRRAKKAIKKQQANRLLITSDTNLVSLVKK